MITKMLGAPLGGTTRGGQHGLDSLALRLISPPKGAGGFGRYLPSTVVVAAGEHGVPVVCVTCAYALRETLRSTPRAVPIVRISILLRAILLLIGVGLDQKRAD